MAYFNIELEYRINNIDEIINVIGTWEKPNHNLRFPDVDIDQVRKNDCDITHKLLENPWFLYNLGFHIAENYDKYLI